MTIDTKYITQWNFDAREVYSWIETATIDDSVMPRDRALSLLEAAVKRIFALEKTRSDTIYVLSNLLKSQVSGCESPTREKDFLMGLFGEGEYD